MASVSEIPREAISPPIRAPANINIDGQQLSRDPAGASTPTIAPDNACDEPAPEAPGGAGKGAIAKDSETGPGFDKVYGVRPKTTWHLKPGVERNLWEFISSLDIGPDVVYQRRAEGADQRGPPPYQPLWKENAWILSRALIPLALHQGWNALMPEYKMHWAPAWLMYHLCFISFAQSLIARLHHYMEKYGCFDEHNRGRDMVDDKHVNHLGRSIFIYIVLRTAGPFLLAWRGDMASPFSGFSWATPLKLAWWEVALDYWFYLYHRSCHEFDFLWFIHRQHHATKHPTPILSILADDIQECLEICIIPILATAVSPKMSFAELFLTAAYTLYVEALGHSGVRAEWPHPVLGLVLKPFGMELAVEDHDLHHRFGKSGKNYGKQTRIWDRIFGTIGERIETVPN